MRIIKIFLINFLLISLIVILIEISAGVGRILIGKNYILPAFKKNAMRFGYTDDPCEIMKTDVILSHIHFTNSKCLIKNGNIFNEEYVYYNSSKFNKKKLLILGGSTTSGFYQKISNGETFPKILADFAKEEYFILNGGVAGYSSLQELYKLVKDGPRIKNLSLVISLNGINELPDYQGSEDIRSHYYPFITSVQNDMNQRQIWISQKISFLYKYFPNISSFLKFTSLRKSTSFKDINEKKEIFLSVNFAERWEINIKRMNAISKAMNAKYLVFLQPTMGLIGPQSNPKKGSADEKIFLNMESDYIDEINKVYIELKKRCNFITYCIDISDKNPPIGNVYNDGRHHNANGNKILAEIIWDEIKKFN